MQPQLNEPDPATLLPQPTPDETMAGEASLSEELALASGLDLQSHKTQRQLKRLLREESAQTHLHRIVVVGLYVVAICAALMFLALVYHYVSPYPFLSAAQLSDLKQLLFSGSLGAGVAQLSKKYLGVQKDENS